MKRLWERHRGHILAWAAIAGLYLALFAAGITCPIKFITGISCPGCGMSRALWHLVTLDFTAALHDHPLCVAVPVVLPPLAWLHMKHKRKPCCILLTVFIAAMLVTYLWRMAAGTGDVVVFSPREGLIYRLTARLLQALSPAWMYGHAWICLQ